MLHAAHCTLHVLQTVGPAQERGRGGWRRVWLIRVGASWQVGGPPVIVEKRSRSSVSSAGQHEPQDTVSVSIIFNLLLKNASTTKVGTADDLYAFFLTNRPIYRPRERSS